MWLTHIRIARQSARGSFVLFIGNFLSTAILAVSAIVIARFLGPELYGTYTLVLLVPSILQLFFGFGVNVAITRFSAYHVSRGEVEIARRMTINSVLFLTLFGAALALVCYLAADSLSATVLHRPSLAPLVQYSAVIVLGQTLFQSMIAVLMGWDAMGLVSVSSIVHATLRVSIAPALVLIGLAVFGAVLGNVLASIIAGVFSVIILFVYRLRGMSRSQGFLSDVRVMTSYGFPLYVGGLVSGFASQYLTIILAAIATNTTVGYYQAAFNFTAAISLTSSAIALTLFPAFAGLDGVRADTSLAFRYAVKYVCYVISPVIFFLIGAAGPLLEVLYGSVYSSGVLYLKLLALSNLPLIIGLSVVPSFFNGLGKTRLTMYLSIIGALPLFVLAPILGGTFGLGVDGLIYSLLASNIVSALAGLAIASRFFKASVEFKPISLLLISSLLSYGLLALTEWIGLSGIAAILVDSVLFSASYLTLAPLLHAIDRKDIERLGIAMDGLGSFAKIIRPFLTYEEMILRVVK